MIADVLSTTMSEPGSAPEPKPPNDRWKRPPEPWLWILIAVYLASFVLIAIVSQLDPPRWIGALVGAVPPVLATVLGIRLRREWKNISSGWRIVIVGGPLAVLVSIIAIYVWWKPIKGTGYFLTISFIVVVGQAISVLRLYASKVGSKRNWLAYAVVLVALVALTGGLLLPDGPWSLILIGGGLILALIALNLLTGVLIARGTAPQLPQLLLGAVIVVLTFAVLGTWFQENLPIRSPWLLAVGTVIFVGLLALAIAADNASDSILIVAVLSLLFFTQPTAPVDQFVGDDSRGYLVALGDSYMSGEGADVFYEGTNDKGSGDECRRAPTAYASLLADSGRPEDFSDLMFLACSGAVGSEVVDRNQGSAPPQLQEFVRQWDQVAGRQDPDLIIISIGGNDAGFGDIVRSCVLPGNCAEIGKQWIDGLPAVGDKVARTYEALRRTLSDNNIEAPVLVVPYPVPLTNTGCPWSSLSFTADEHRFLFGFVTELDAVLKAQAAKAGFHYLDAMENVLLEKNLAICSLDESGRSVPPDQIGVNFIGLNSVVGSPGDITNPKNWIHNSMHPNSLGHAAMRDVLVQWRSNNPDPAVSTVPTPAAEHEVETFDEVMDASGAATTAADIEGKVDANAWVFAELAGFLKTHVLPLVILGIAAWLVALQVLRWRGQRVRR